MRDCPNAENTPRNFPTPDTLDTTVAHRPGGGSRSPEDIEAVIAEIDRLLWLDSGRPHLPPSTPFPPDAYRDGLIEVDGPRTLEWFPDGPPMPPLPPGQ